MKKWYLMFTRTGAGNIIPNVAPIAHDSGYVDWRISHWDINSLYFSVRKAELRSSTARNTYQPHNNTFEGGNSSRPILSKWLNDFPNYIALQVIPVQVNNTEWIFI
jgi:hypothetical protein